MAKLRANHLHSTCYAGIYGQTLQRNNERLYTQTLRFAKDTLFYSNCTAYYAASSDHEKDHERVEKRSPRMPSKLFMSRYLNSFRNIGEEAVAIDDEDLIEANALFNEALSFTTLQEYSQAIDSIENAVVAVEKTNASRNLAGLDANALR
ncbi:hypothetical protein GGH12_005157 [Coemansia sp. RSA 1822]|nr:hypothetical protein LPJ76_005112 [Coemansia sp. RSA 638]KAJ2559987.1 hypothetical protein GGH12_005157 [Coemansia sp. RSA 1822]